jgi:hypothetical protein
MHLRALARQLSSRARQSKALRRPALDLEYLEDRTVPTLLSNQLFPSDNPWNQRISSAPVASNSTAIINAIISEQGANGQLHPDFSQDAHTHDPLYGIPYNVVHGNSTPKVTVVIDSYASESNVQPAPVPANAVIEGDYRDGPNVGLANRGDSHLLVYDVDNNVDYEFFAASRPNENSDGHWHAAQESVWDLRTNTFRTIGWTSADAAGLPILPGLARPDEGLPVGQGGQGVINHAIRVTLDNPVILDQFLYPASHIANSGSNAAIQPPMGARLRLKANVDLSQLSPQSRVIAQAMKDYGLIVADNGSNFFFSGASDAVNSGNQDFLTWDNNDIQDNVHGLKSLHFSDFEVVNLTPVVTGLSAHSGPAGTAVTVLGQNFSGAAGHLQVFFGSTSATSVTAVDDGHVVAVAPPGSGTVDVRVQSGVSTAPDSQNLLNTVFGYGTSAVSASDRFTYGAASNPPPSGGGSPPPSGGGSTTPPANGGGSAGSGGGSGVVLDTIGVVDPSSYWYLRGTNTGGAPDIGPFAYGAPGWVPLAGDWNGDGKTTLGVFDPNTATWYLKNSNTAGGPDIAPFRYGAPGWIPVVGDWDGNGTVTIGVVDPATMTWYLRNSNSAGAPDITPFRFGGPGWKPVVGDWTGDGKTTIGVVDPQGRWYLRNSDSGGAPDITPFAYGAPGWTPVVGDWGGNGKTTVGVLDPSTATWYLKYSNTGGAPDLKPFAFGGAGWKPVVGDWIFPALAERAAGGGGPGTPRSSSLTPEELASVRQAALTRLADAGVSPPEFANLATVQLSVAPLPTGYLGLAYPDANRVVLDASAAGYGWFIDPTPLTAKEFRADGSAVPGGPASGRVDLLTVVMHELGHIAGLPDDDGNDLMGGTLSAGVRRVGGLTA